MLLQILIYIYTHTHTHTHTHSLQRPPHLGHGHPSLRPPPLLPQRHHPLKIRGPHVCVCRLFHDLCGRYIKIYACTHSHRHPPLPSHLHIHTHVHTHTHTHTQIAAAYFVPDFFDTCEVYGPSPGGCATNVVAFSSNITGILAAIPMFFFNYSSNCMCVSVWVYVWRREEGREGDMRHGRMTYINVHF